MKKQLQKILLIGGIGMLAFTTTKAQTTSTFELLTLSPNSYWNGSSTPLGTTFTDGNAVFLNYYDTAYGGYWASGWAYSNMKDSTTAGSTNMYSARPAIGFANSANYAVGQQSAMIKLTGVALGKLVNGLYVTNGTYAAISMRDGDGIARKFGDTTGTGSGLPQGDQPDWFKLTVHKYLSGVMTNDSVEFYLADYRFSNNVQDYIVNDWQWVDLTSIGNVDSLKFILSSSDVGMYGMNTPAFFCIDNFTTADSPWAISEIDPETSGFISLFPNPTSNNITINLQNLKSDQAPIALPDCIVQAGIGIQIIDAIGKLVYSETTNTVSLQIPVAHLPNGIYYLKATGNNFAGNKSFIKQ